MGSHVRNIPDSQCLKVNLVNAGNVFDRRWYNVHI